LGIRCPYPVRSRNENPARVRPGRGLANPIDACGEGRLGGCSCHLLPRRAPGKRRYCPSSVRHPKKPAVFESCRRGSGPFEEIRGAYKANARPRPRVPHRLVVASATPRRLPSPRQSPTNRSPAPPSSASSAWIGSMPASRRSTPPAPPTWCCATQHQRVRGLRHRQQSTHWSRPVGSGRAGLAARRPRRRSADRRGRVGGRR
jgi:hypothetical protein